VFARKEAERVNEISRSRGSTPNAEYRGFYLAQVSDVRALPHWDIFVEPIAHDPAHANLVVDAEALDSENKVEYPALEDLLPLITFYAPESDMQLAIEQAIR
jgi:hypothetical protein